MKTKTNTKSKQNESQYQNENLSLSYADILYEVLANETGYPIDSLSPQMDLENDLGLDSIKKVELFSALSERLPDILPASLTKAETLGQLINIIEEQSQKTKPAPFGLVRRVVAAETGYPVETLTAQLDLENDLGLDSIKKVEILSSLSDTVLSSSDQSRLSGARTLGDWEDFFESERPKAAPGNGSGLVAQATPSPQNPLLNDLGSNKIDSSSHTASPRSTGRDLLDKALGKTDPPSLWHVQPEPFSPDGHGACLWPPSGLFRLVGSDALTKGLEKELKKNGYEVERRPWCYDFEKWRQDARQPRVLFLVWPGPDRNPDLITQALRALENSGPQLESIVGLSFLGGYFGFPRPDGSPHSSGNSISGSLVGLLKCAAQEWPNVNVRALDIPLAIYEVPTSSWLTTILEMAASPGPVELGLPIRNQPFCLNLKPYQPTAAKEPLLASGDTVVVTGGGRGVTAVVLSELARLYKPRLVILGRTPISPPEPDWLSGLESERQIMEALHRLSGRTSTPKELEARAHLILSSRELRRNLAALTAAGATIEYISGDFTNAPFIEETARRLRLKYGPIKGFIHGAGILADHPIIGKSQADFARVYATKTLLSSLLLETFQPEPLRLIVFFSSSTARFGRQGQSDYAAGNEVLNKTAWELSLLHPQCRVLALNWGPWAGGMVTDSLADQFRSQGVGLIGLKEGVETFVKLINSPAGEPAEVVVLGAGTSLESLSGQPILGSQAKSHLSQAFPGSPSGGPLR